LLKGRICEGKIKMNRKDVLAIGVIAGGIVLILAVIFFIYCRVEQQSVVLILTAGVVSWYAWETREMRKELVHQTIIQSTPFMSIFIKRIPTGKGKFELDKLWVRNDGEGTARKVELKALQPFSETEMLSFRTVQILPKGDKKELIIERIAKETGKITLGSNDEMTRMYLNDLKEKSWQEECSFELKYENIINDIYHAKVIFKDEEFLIANPVKTKSGKL
jgi:hypothetical protein